MFLFFAWQFGSHVDCFSQKYTIYVLCQHEDVYSGFKRVNFVFMLFLLIYLYWCPTRFQYQIMFLSYYRKAKNVTSRKDISYSPPRGSPAFTPCSLHSSCCSIFCVMCLVFYISQFVLWSVSIWPWYCLSFVSFPLTMILSVFCHFTFSHDIVCLFRCTASDYLFDIFKPVLHSYEIVICPLSGF